MSSPIPEDKTFKPDTVVLEKYHIIKILNNGAHGNVYLAQNQLSGRQVALKQIPINNDHEYTRIIEARAQALCDHPNIVKFFSGDVLNFSGQLWLLIEMEYISYGSLADRIKNGFLPANEAVRYIKDILFAVEKANSLEIVHRDIKPGNIMLAKPNAQLSDFGVVIDTNSGFEVLAGRFYIPHASPEAIHNQEFGPETDVFCAGMALFAAVNNFPSISELVGAQISRNEYQKGLSEGDLHRRIGFQAYVPQKIKNIIRKACAPKVEDRYAVASKFRNALEKLSFQHSWQPIGQNLDHWRSQLNGDAEVVIRSGKRFEVDYLIAGRRRLPQCSTHTTLVSAQKAALQLVSKTALK